MEDIKPGSILINTSTNKLYGVLVSILPNNKIVVFRLDKNTHPIFSKFDIHPYITKVGIINQFQYSSMKSALLKYYRTYNLTLSEKKMLKALMEFAFPLGIPEYKPEVELPERDIEMMDLHSKLITGNRIMLNTPSNSCYKHLNNKRVDIIEKNEKGIWINLPNNEINTSALGNSLSFLFYKNREVPTFGGISRITPITLTNDINNNINNNINNTNNLNNTNNTNNTIKNNENYNVILDTFKKLKDNNELTTMMEYNGEKIRLLPSTGKVIFPDVYEHMIYNPHQDLFTIEKENVSKALANKLGDKLIISSKDEVGNLRGLTGLGMDNEYDFSSSQLNKSTSLNQNNEYVGKIDIDENGELIFEGGSKNKHKKTYEDIESIFEDMDNNELIMAKYGELSNVIDESSNDDFDSLFKDDDNNNYDNDDDNYDNYDNDNNDTIYNKNKGLNESIDETTREIRDRRRRLLSTTSQTTNNTDSDYDEDDFEEIINEDDIIIEGTYEKIKKVELEEKDIVIPERLQRGNMLKYKIEELPSYHRNNPIKIENIKKYINIVSLLKNNISTNIDETTGEKAKDNRYINFKKPDYKPLLSKYVKGDYTNKYLIPLVLNRKKIFLNKDKKIDKDDYDIKTTEVIDNFYENLNDLITIQDKKNISVNYDVYKKKLINELNPTSINESDSVGLVFRLGENLEKDNFKRLFQDTITIKYCDKPMKCESYGLQTTNFDYQVNLGPLSNFISSATENALDNNTTSDNISDNTSDNTSNHNDTLLQDNNQDHSSDDTNIIKSNILTTEPKFKVYYEGDKIRIIGYVRPPLSYFNTITDCQINQSQQTLFTQSNSLLNNLYKLEKTKNNIITIELEDINPEINDDDDNRGDNDNNRDDDDHDNNDKKNKFNITQHPDKFILYLFKQKEFNYTHLEEQIEKVIPNMNDIITLYLNKIEYCSIDSIYSILEKFEYDYNELTIDMYDKLIKKHQKLIEFHTKLDTKLKTKFDVYMKKVVKEKKEKEENEKKYKNRIISDINDKKANTFKYITNDIMDELSAFYFNSYDNKNINIDNDEIRLKWFKTNFDNGQFVFHTILINYLKMYQESHSIENLETELALIKEKHIMMRTNASINQPNKSTPHNQSNQSNQSNLYQPSFKKTQPSIIQYPNKERLEKDNYKEVIDSDGNVILVGDYALVKEDNTRKLYKRSLVGNSEMWTSEDLATLYKLIQDKRNNCIETPELNLQDESLYDLDLDSLKCIEKDYIEENINNMNEEQLKVELQINDLQKELDYVKNIPIIIASINKEMTHLRLNLINKVNSEKLSIKNNEDKLKKDEEIIKNTLKTIKPCIHFKLTDKFHQISQNYEKYIIGNIILDHFENTEYNYNKSNATNLTSTLSHLSNQSNPQNLPNPSNPSNPSKPSNPTNPTNPTYSH